MDFIPENKTTIRGDAMSMAEQYYLQCYCLCAPRWFSFVVALFLHMFWRIHDDDDDNLHHPCFYRPSFAYLFFWPITQLSFGNITPSISSTYRCIFLSVRLFSFYCVFFYVHNFIFYLFFLRHQLLVGKFICAV